MKSVLQLKQEVASYILKQLEGYQVILLGSGSTVNEVIRASNADKSFVSASQATSLELDRHNLSEIQLKDVLNRDNNLCVDGADQILKEGGIIIKGHGGALVREKITWNAADEILVAIDERKISDNLSKTIPICIVPFALRAVMKKLQELSQIENIFIKKVDGLPYNTDDGMLILHLHIAENSDLYDLDLILHSIPGIVETGIFLRDNFSKVTIICATQDDIITY